MVTSSLHKQRKVTRSPKGSESLCLCFRLSLQPQPQSRSRSRAFARLRRASTPFFACAKKGGPKRRFSTAEWLVKHTLPTRLPRCALQVHSAGRIFRRYIPVSSKNDVRPARRPVRVLVCQLRRCGRGPVGQRLQSNCNCNGNCNCNCKATAPLPGPPLRCAEGRGNSHSHSHSQSHSQSQSQSQSQSWAVLLLLRGERVYSIAKANTNTSAVALIPGALRARGSITGRLMSPLHHACAANSGRVRLSASPSVHSTSSSMRTPP